MKPIVFVLFALTLTTSASAGPVLLASLDNRVQGGGSAPADRIVEFVLSLDNPEMIAELGRGVFWEDGDAGSVEFSAETDPAFSQFAALATNGSDDFLWDGVLWPSRFSGVLYPSIESEVFHGAPDLIGYELDFVLLTVRSVHFEPWVPDGFEGNTVHYDLTYEFYGHVIPEPATAVLVLAALPAIIKRAGGKCDFRIWRSKP